MLPIQSVTSPLYVIAPIINPSRYRSRYDLYKNFEKYITSVGAVLYTVEAAYGDRPFEITETDNPNHIQLRSKHELWHKENLINIGVSRLPADWKYVAWIDPDVQFARADIVSETIEQLQHFSVVQMFSHALDLGPQHQPLKTFNGFVSQWMKAGQKAPANMEQYEVWHPGYAWACTREAWDHLGGLLDFGIVGSADRYMACGLIGEMSQALSDEIVRECPVYTEWCKEWETRAEAYIKHNIGFVDGLLMHYFHGAKKNRNYFSRPAIVWKNAFDPSKDIKRDWQGLWQLSDQKIKLRDQLRTYFRSRNEDGTEL